MVLNFERMWNEMPVLVLYRREHTVEVVETLVIMKLLNLTGK